MLKCPKNLVGKKIGSTFVSGMKKDSFVWGSSSLCM